MDFGVNKLSIEVIREGAFGGSRFRRKLVKMIKYADSKLDDYLHWGYELTEKYFLLT